MDEITALFRSLLAALQALRTEERTPRDRYVAITITVVEQAFALFTTYVRTP
jgi:hypothetical protein